MKGYRSSIWKGYRADMIRLHGYRCSECGRTSASGAVLQVHHTRYISDRQPWEYPHSLCVVMCKGCHAAKHGIIAPKFGWVCEGFEDLGGLDGQCDCCGTELRYVFFVTHENWPPMEVGTHCCDALTCEAAASTHMESHLRYVRRLKTFIGSRRWVRRPAGVEGIKHARVHFEVLPAERGGYRLRIEGEIGKTVYSTAVEAKCRIFELSETGDLQRLLAKRKRRWGLSHN